MNAYAASYTDPDTGDEILYFALERNKNTGNANVAFWFLQDEVACESNGGTANFSGDHMDGDLLIVSAFTNGGSVSNVDVYRWNRPGNPDGVPGSLDPTPVVTGGADCKTTGAGDQSCATVNTGTITTPWLTANFKSGVGNTLLSTEFYEGGLNLTDSGLGGKCFNTFTADTRSSQSLTATLFDYSLGNLGECDSKTVTTPTPAAGTETVIPASGTLTTSDSALLTVSGVSTFSGTLSFSLCGPLALDSLATCTSGGVAISSQTVTASGTYGSGNATVTSVGKYCWRAEFSGDDAAGVPGSSDSSETECFKVTPRQPVLDTDAGDGPVDFGQPVTDTATLTNTANRPGTGGPVGSNGSINPDTPGAKAGGTITFTLYKADCTTPATGTANGSLTRTVDGDGSYGPVSFTPDAPGTYHWKASYSGDSPNTLGDTHNDACDDPDESVVVRQIPTKISTDQSVYPNDSATVESSVAGKNLPAGGTVTFRLYDTVANCQLGGDTVGSGGLLYKETDTIAGGALTETESTSNTSVSVSANATIAWLVTYAPGDSAFTGIQSNCVERTALTFTEDPGPGTLFPTPIP